MSFLSICPNVQSRNFKGELWLSLFKLIHRVSNIPCTKKHLISAFSLIENGHIIIQMKKSMN